jgi:adenine-specific DNA-methyltransferase
MMNGTLFGEQQEVKNQFDASARIVLHHGDTHAFVETIPDESVSLIVTSPPYNLGKDYETRAGIQTYLQHQANLIKQLHRVLRSDGSICWQVGNFVENGEIFPLDILYYDIFKKLGMKLRNRIVWRFGHGLHASKRFSGRYETILWFTKSDQYIFNLDSVRVPSKYPGKLYYKGDKRGQPSGNPLGKNPSDIWEVVAHDWETELWDIPNVKANHPEKTEHPCQYPIELVERCVLALTREDDWVFDPYAGVGASLLAAIMRNRKAMGSEKELAYVEAAQKRIDDYANGKLGYRVMGTPVFQPTGKEKVSQVPKEWGNEKNEEPLQHQLLEGKAKYQS